MFSKAIEIFITELSLRAWLHTEEAKRRTVQVVNRQTEIHVQWRQANRHGDARHAIETDYSDGHTLETTDYSDRHTIVTDYRDRHTIVTDILRNRL